MVERNDPRHLIRLHDLSREEIEDLMERSIRFKREGTRPASLSGVTLGLLFFRGSLRTRASFSAATHQLGGHTLNLSADSDFWQLEVTEGSVMDGAAPEHIKDAAQALSSYVDLLAIRPKAAGQSWNVDKKDAQIRSWAKHANVPVVNMESSLWHPLQALADLVTLRETLGGLEKKQLAITWTHSPTQATHAVTNSLLHAALRMGMQVRVANPPGFDLDEGIWNEAQEIASSNGGELVKHNDQKEALEGANVVYARSWSSLEHYGNPTLMASQRSRHSDWKLDESRMALGDEAKLMHAMPVRRNVEVADSVLDGPRSMVGAQAANRLHSQKALLSKWLAN